jgi:hypothetical protein
VQQEGLGKFKNSPLYRGRNEFKRGYQLRNNLVKDVVKDENGDLLADTQNILKRWNYFSQLLNVHNVSDIRQKYIQLNH